MKRPSRKGGKTLWHFHTYSFNLHLFRIKISHQKQTLFFCFKNNIVFNFLMQNWMWRVTLGPAYPQRVCSQIFLCICRISSIICIFIVTWFFCKFNNCWLIQIIKLHMLSERNETPCINAVKKFFFSIWVFFYKHSQITGLQDFHLLHRHLDISRAITVQSSPLHKASSWTRTGNL